MKESARDDQMMTGPRRRQGVDHPIRTALGLRWDRSLGRETHLQLE
jgi:hypothetical protein